MAYSIERMPERISIGRETETGVTDVMIDCGAWVSKWPGMALHAIYTPEGGAPYILQTETDGGVLVWHVTDADTATPGTGSMEIVGEMDGRRKVSATVKVSVAARMSGTVGEPPEAANPWADRVVEAAERITGMQAQAKTLDDGSGATAAWDGEQGLLTIGVPKGEQGPKGEKGEKGPQGEKGEPGKDAVVDATLTKSGQAADAKVTGDVVSQLKDDFDNVRTVENNNLLIVDDISETTSNGVTYSIKDNVLSLNGTVTGSNLNIAVNKRCDVSAPVTLFMKCVDGYSDGNAYYAIDGWYDSESNYQNFILSNNAIKPNTLKNKTVTPSQFVYISRIQFRTGLELNNCKIEISLSFGDEYKGTGKTVKLNNIETPFIDEKFETLKDEVITKTTNVLKITDRDTTSNGIRCVVNNGIIHFSGTSTDSIAFGFLDKPINAGTYRFGIRRDGEISGTGIIKFICNSNKSDKLEVNATSANSFINYYLGTFENNLSDIHIYIPKGISIDADMYIWASIGTGYDSFSIEDSLKIEHKHYGKSYLFIGDSITNYGVYVNEMCYIMHPSKVVNVSVPGATWHDDVNTVYDGNPSFSSNNTIGNQIQKVINEKQSGNADYADFDCIILAAGTNDMVGSIANDTESFYTSDDGIVNVESIDRTKVNGAIRWCCEKLMTLYPTSQMFLCTPIQSANDSRDYKSMMKRVNVISESGSRLSIPVIDTHMCGIYGLYETINSNGKFLIDGLHENAYGGKIHGEYLARFLKNWYA